MTGSRGPRSKPGAIHRGSQRATTRLERTEFDIPELGEGFSEKTERWWADWLASPQTRFFVGTDWQTLLRLAPLVDAYYSEPTPALHSEIRQTESKLGATAGDRERLGWKVAESEPPPEAPPEPRPDPRLTYVEDEARRARQAEHLLGAKS